MLKKESGMWVYDGEQADDSLPELIDRARDKRLRSQME
jgi:hypothetical protein